MCSALRNLQLYNQNTKRPSFNFMNVFNYSTIELNDSIEYGECVLLQQIHDLPAGTCIEQIIFCVFDAVQTFVFVHNCMQYTFQLTGTLVNGNIKRAPEF
jgi:hypothetical protein